METLHIIKIGGHVINDDKLLLKFIEDFSKIKEKKILVHGGGNITTALAEKLGIKTKIEQGRRITDAETLKLATMTYAGWINKRIVALLNALGCEAIGVCGADLNLIPAMKKPVAEIDYGYVGDIRDNGISSAKWMFFLNHNICPIVSPITSTVAGQLLNTNADSVASSLAKSLSVAYKTKLVYCFEKSGVLSDPDNDHSVISKIDLQGYRTLKQKNMITEGMIPKIENSFAAIESGVSSVVIGKSSDLSSLIQPNHAKGTLLTK